MSIQRLEATQLVTVFMSTQVDDTKTLEEPPLLKTEIADDYRRQQVGDTIAMAARSWDIYRTLVQLSFYWNGRHYHLLLCDDPDWNDKRTFGTLNEPERLVMFFTDESELVTAAFALIREIYGNMEGRPLYDRMMVGWRMYSEIWPFLVNRAIKYKIPVYRDMLVGADSKWPTTKYLGDIAALYLQGGNPGRKLPGLADLLRFWGFGHDEHRPLPEDLGAAVCDDPVGTAKEIERYLKDMHEVLCMYYGANQTDTLDPRAGLPVPPSGEV